MISIAFLRHVAYKTSQKYSTPTPINYFFYKWNKAVKVKRGGGVIRCWLHQGSFLDVVPCIY